MSFALPATHRLKARHEYLANHAFVDETPNELFDFGFLAASDLNGIYMHGAFLVSEQTDCIAMQRNRLTQHHRIARDHPAHHPHSDWFRGIASLPRMRPNNELFISRTTTQRALSDDCTFDRVYTLRPIIERKKGQ